jgi:2-polyprenyl-3-methyl-5-hydroxy-6-metoxy-1,4-benzoquinol methylase
MKTEEANIPESFLQFLKMHGERLESVLDIGCAEGKMLFRLEELGFKKLTGFDLCWHNWESNYVNAMFNYHRKTKKELVLPNELKSRFGEKYIIQQQDYRSFEFKKYNCIVCKDVIHLLPHEEQFALIKIIYESLEPGGTILILINGEEFKNQIDAKNYIEIAPRTIKGIGKQSEKTMYLRPCKEFEMEITSYSWQIAERIPLLNRVCYFLKK